MIFNFDTGINKWNFVSGIILLLQFIHKIFIKKIINYYKATIFKIVQVFETQVMIVEMPYKGKTN